MKHCKSLQIVTFYLFSTSLLSNKSSKARVFWRMIGTRLVQDWYRSGTKSLLHPILSTDDNVCRQALFHLHYININVINSRWNFIRFISFSLNHIGRSGAIKSANAATDAPNSTVPLIAFNVPSAVLIILFLGFSAADSVSITSRLS